MCQNMASINDILVKDILTVDDISTFIRYYRPNTDSDDSDSGDDGLDYDDYDQMMLKVTKMNDQHLWEMLYQYMDVDIVSCLVHGVKYANYEFFGHILSRFRTQTSYKWIDFNDLCQWASQNSDCRVRLFIERLRPLLGSSIKFDRSFILQNEQAVFDAYSNIQGMLTKRACR